MVTTNGKGTKTIVSNTKIIKATGKIMRTTINTKQTQMVETESRCRLPRRPRSFTQDSFKMVDNSVKMAWLEKARVMEARATGITTGSNSMATSIHIRVDNTITITMAVAITRTKAT